MTPEELLPWVALIGGIITILVALAKLAQSVRRKWVEVADFLTDWQGTPARPGVERRPGIPERLAQVEESSAIAAFNTGPDHGESPHDELLRRFDAVDGRITALDTHLGVNHPGSVDPATGRPVMPPPSRYDPHSDSARQRRTGPEA